MLLLVLLLLAVFGLWVVVRVVLNLGCLGVGAREFDSAENPS